MKKRIIILFVVLVGILSIDLQAQQIHQLTQYTLNNFVYNPAIAGTDVDHILTKASFRRQWWGGFNGEEPVTFFISGHGNFNQSKTVGLGAILFGDITGPTERLGLQLAYAYHIPLDDANRNYLSLGLSGTLMQYSVNFDQLELLDAGDAAAMEASRSRMTGDANFGAYLYGENYWIGLSAMQLVQSRIKLSELSEDLDSETLRLAQHFYGSAGYRFDLTDEFDLEPSLMIKVVQNVPISYELNLRAFYQEQYWFGLGYRSADAISFMLGLDLNNGLNFAYSYDVINSGINQVTDGSHELSIGYKIKWRKAPMKAEPFKYDTDI